MSDEISSGFCSLEDLMKLSRKGGHWEPVVDENWKPGQSRRVQLTRSWQMQRIAITIISFV